MKPASDDVGSHSPRGFSWWVIVVWMVLLFAAIGAVQYTAHANYVYLLGSIVVIGVCAGCLLRVARARSIMRVLALLLAVWSLVTAVLMLQQWDQFAVARLHASNEPQLRELSLWLIARAQRTWQVGIALKAFSIPVLAWLSWQLGKPAVRAQFRSRQR